jgi:hypothetical protein
MSTQSFGVASGLGTLPPPLRILPVKKQITKIKIYNKIFS